MKGQLGSAEPVKFKCVPFERISCSDLSNLPASYPRTSSEYFIQFRKNREFSRINSVYVNIFDRHKVNGNVLMGEFTVKGHIE